MTNIIVASAVLILLIIGAIWVMISREENDLLPYSNATIIAALFCVITYVTFMFTDEIFSAYLFSNLYYSCTLWLLLLLHLYTRAYIKTPKIRKPLLIFFIVICSLDTFFGIQNSFIPLFYKLTRQRLMNSNFIYWKVTNTPLFTFHYFNGTIIIWQTCYLLIKRIANCPVIYRGNYIKYLLSYIAVVIINIMVSVFNFPVDLSILFFIAMTDTLFLYPCIKGHRKLIYQTLKISANNSKDILICFNDKGENIFSNEEAKNFLKTAKLSTRQPELYLEDFIEKYNLSKKDFFKVEEQIKVDGEIQFFEIIYKKLIQDKTCIGSMLTFINKTEAIKEYEAERYRANHDQLTGLFNRYYFYQRANEALKAEPSAKWLMVASDIKDFKLINETQGTEVGDEVLKYYADLIIKNTNKNSIYGRISDDRFAILIREKDFNKQVFIDAIAKLAELTDVNGYKLQINFGIYRTEYAMESSMLMFDKAELAIANNNNRQQSQFIEYNPEIMKKFLDDKTILADFNYALRSNQFKLYLQPVYSNKNKILGAEALVRYVEPGQKPKLPKTFVSVLEDAGYIYELDKYIWRETAKLLQTWATLPDKKDLFISVNISGKDIKYLDVKQELLNLEEEFHFPPQNFKLEFTDTAVTENPEKALQLAEDAAAAGFGIIIDNFGAEYSTLRMLRDIKADILKLDVLNSGAQKLSEKEMTILKNIVEMAKILNMKVILKKVETKAQLENLSDLGCNMYQGFYFSNPVAVNDFEKK